MVAQSSVCDFEIGTHASGVLQSMYISTPEACVPTDTD
jgi:hypothetical protein